MGLEGVLTDPAMDDRLIEQARKNIRPGTKKETTVTAALERYIRRKRLEVLS